MGRPEIKIPEAPYTYGGDRKQLCRECQLPCQHEVTSVDCFRRFFLQGLLGCTYLVYGYCFLVDEPGCVLDNGGRHDTYWLNLLNDYFHNVSDRDESDPDFARRAAELKQLVADHIANRQVSLCRYIEEYYHRLMEDGGGLSEDVMEKVDEAYLALLRGTKRKS
jgi:hypothetical protein